MQNKYEMVPTIITGKDLDYLSDMFNWNYGALKKCCNCIDKIETSELKEVVEKAKEIFFKNLNVILSILSEGGANE